MKALRLSEVVWEVIERELARAAATNRGSIKIFPDKTKEQRAAANRRRWGEGDGGKGGKGGKGDKGKGKGKDGVQRPIGGDKGKGKGGKGGKAAGGK
eukprot:16438886-Heterocapsa_arctica.AAC.1